MNKEYLEKNYKEYVVNGKEIYVAKKRLILDKRVKEAVQGIINTKKHKDGEILTNINWYTTMLILERLGSRAMTLTEYWKILEMIDRQHFDEEYNGGEWIGCLIKNKKELVENIKVTKKPKEREFSIERNKSFYSGDIRECHLPRKEGFFEEEDVVNGMPTILYSMTDYEAECTLCYAPPASDLTAILHQRQGEIIFACDDSVPVWQINLSHEPSYSHLEIGVREIHDKGWP